MVLSVNNAVKPRIDGVAKTINTMEAGHEVAI
jgi:hypothetical protein